MFILCIQHMRSEGIEIVVPVVMEMLRRVHEKFTLHYSLMLPPIGRKMLPHPRQLFLLYMKTKALFLM